jgi:hypothetical protein
MGLLKSVLLFENLTALPNLVVSKVLVHVAPVLISEIAPEKPWASGLTQTEFLHLFVAVMEAARAEGRRAIKVRVVKDFILLDISSFERLEEWMVVWL